VKTFATYLAVIALILGVMFVLGEVGSRWIAGMTGLLIGAGTAYATMRYAPVTAFGESKFGKYAAILVGAFWVALGPDLEDRVLGWIFVGGLVVSYLAVLATIYLRSAERA
jgi:hypothetical protein